MVRKGKAQLTSPKIQVLVSSRASDERSKSNPPTKPINDCTIPNPEFDRIDVDWKGPDRIKPKNPNSGGAGIASFGSFQRDRSLKSSSSKGFFFEVLIVEVKEAGVTAEEMLHFPDPVKLKTRKIVFEDVFHAIDCGTLEQLKELSSKRRVIEESVNATRMITEAVAREMSKGLTSRSEQDLQKLKLYLPLLENFVSYVEMHSSNNTMTRLISNLRIQWSSVLASSSFLNLMGPKFFQVDNIRFELGMMLFLYVAILRERAYEIITSDLVQSTTLFREAAGVYHYLSHDVIPSLQSPQTSGQKPPEVASSVTAAMSLTCLAEAQSVTIRKAEERKATASLLIKLHRGVGEFASEAIHFLHSGATEVKDGSGRFMEYLSSLKELHELRSKRYLAQDLRSSEQIGFSIEVLRQALINGEKKIPGDESWRLVLRKEIDEVVDILRKYENENEVVWHQRIAPGDELPAPTGSKILNILNYRPTKHESPLVFKL